MTQPVVVPAEYNNTRFDYLDAKVDRNGNLRSEVVNITIPNASAVGALIGVVPFRKGFRFNFASMINVPAIGAGTLNVGYIYANAGTVVEGGVTLADDPDAFASAVAAGTYVTFDEPVVGMNFVSLDDGWIVLQVVGTAVTGPVTAVAQVIGSYDAA